jgi:hypothetical protein
MMDTGARRFVGGKEVLLISIQCYLQLRFAKELSQPEESRQRYSTE